MAVTNTIIKAISEKTGQPPFRVRAYLHATTDLISQALAEGDHVTLAKLGTFKLLRLPAREVKTHLNGRDQVLKLPAGTTADFVADPHLKTTLDNPPPKEEKRSEPERNPHSKAAHVGYAELTGKTVPKNILALVPEPIARRFQAVPFALAEKTLSVGMSDPEDEEAFNALRKASGKLIKPFIATQEDIAFVLDQYSALQSELKELVDNEDTSDLEEVKEKEEKVDADEMSETSPAAKIVGSLLKRAVREKASDIHVEPSEDQVEVRFRIDGVLHKVLSLPKEIQAAVTSRVKILANLKIDETRLPQDGRIQILLDGNKVDFRVSTLPTVTGEKIVARVLDHAKGVLTLEELGVRGRAFDVLVDNIKKSHGITLITGPTGSGKSTTLYAIISRIKDVSVNIVTMEDPVEYRMPGINQSQVNARIGFTFASGLRSILRQDPNIVMVGEIRDRETADIAINAALTGHIVLSSLHTNDASGSLPRLIDMGIEPFLITSSTNAIVGQRLCRKICEKCRKETPIKPEDSQVVEQEIDTLPDPEKSEAKKKKTFYKGEGCSACNNSGYKGRIGIFEVLGVTEPIRQLTLKRATSAELAIQAKKDGLISMKQDGILKALDGLTTIEEVWRVTKD